MKRSILLLLALVFLFAISATKADSTSPTKKKTTSSFLQLLEEKPQLLEHLKWRNNDVLRQILSQSPKPVPKITVEEYAALLSDAHMSKKQLRKFINRKSRENGGDKDDDDDWVGTLNKIMVPSSSKNKVQRVMVEGKPQPLADSSKIKLMKLTVKPVASMGSVQRVIAYEPILLLTDFAKINKKQSNIKLDKLKAQLVAPKNPVSTFRIASGPQSLSMSDADADGQINFDAVVDKVNKVIEKVDKFLESAKKQKTRANGKTESLSDAQTQRRVTRSHLKRVPRTRFGPMSESDGVICTGSYCRW